MRVLTIFGLLAAGTVLGGASPALAEEKVKLAVLDLVDKGAGVDLTAKNIKIKFFAIVFQLQTF